MNNTVCGRFSVEKIIQFRKCIFSNIRNIFCHLKLEIALAIPASNDKKYSSAGQGLKVQFMIIFVKGCRQWTWMS